MTLQDFKNEVAQAQIKDAEYQVFFKDWEDYQSYCFFNDDIDLLISAADQAAELYASQQQEGSKWEKIEDRKPEDWQEVFLYYPDIKIIVASIYFKANNSFDVDWLNIGRYTHWTPKPKGLFPTAPDSF